MTKVEAIIEIVRVLIYLGGIVGLGFWIRSLNGTIKAQEKTINAQGEILNEFKSLTTTMKEVVESTNAPKMLERVKAYEEFADKERDAAIKAEKEKAHGASKQLLDLMSGEIQSRVDTYSKLIMYVPPNARKEVIKSLKKPTYFTEEEATAFYEKVAAEAPYLTHPSGGGGLLGSLLAFESKTFGEIFPREGQSKPPEPTETGGKLRERLIGKKDKE